MRCVWMVATLCALDAAPVVAKEPGAAAARLFSTHARLAVDATGAVTAVEPDAALSSVVQDAIRTTAMGWRFEPALKHGRAVGGVTHASVRGCLAEIGDGLRMQFSLRGTGPRAVSGPSTPGPPTSLARANDVKRFELTYRVDADGRGTLTQLQQIAGRPSSLAAFRRQVDAWMSQRRFAAEELDGTPVATRMTTELSYASGGSIEEVMRKMPEVAAIRREERECAVALRTDSAHPQATVALDSPFRPHGDI